MLSPGLFTSQHARVHERCAAVGQALELCLDRLPYVWLVIFIEERARIQAVAKSVVVNSDIVASDMSNRDEGGGGRFRRVGR